MTALAAQKTKTADLQAQVDKIPQTVATDLRSHLIRVHQIGEQTASMLITGTTPEQVIAQVAAVTCGRQVRLTALDPLGSVERNDGNRFGWNPGGVVNLRRVEGG